MDFSQKLKNIKEIQRITNYKIAKSLDCSQSTVANWLSGKSVPNLDIIEKLSFFFNVPVSYFYDDKKTSLPSENDKLVSEIVEKFPKLTEEEQDIVLRMINQFTKDKN